MPASSFSASAIVTIARGDSVGAGGHVDAELRSDSVRGGRSGSNTISFPPIVSTDPLPNLPPDAPTDPQLSPGDRGYELTLPKVQPLTRRSLSLIVKGVRCEIEGVDASNSVVRWEISNSLDEPSSGSVVLAEGVGQDLDPALAVNTHLRRGARISLFKILPDSSEEVSFENYYIVEAPDYEPLAGGGATVTLIVGDEFRITDGERLTLSEPYCGPDPQTAGEAMTLFFELRRGVRLPFPDGSKLIEPVQRIRNENAHNFASALFGGAGLQVRTDRLNRVRVARRPTFDSDRALELSYTSLLSPPRRIVAGELPYSSVEGNSEGTLLRRPQFRQVSDRLFARGYDPLDLTPWFLGGRGGFVDRIRQFVGETLVYERRVSQGYIPNVTSFLRSADTSGPCIDSSTSGAWNSGNVTFGTYETFEFKIDSVPHPNGARRITRESSRIEGLQFLLEGDTYTRYPASGLATLRESQIEYTSISLPDDLVCPKDYTWVITQAASIEREVIDTSFALVNIRERLTRSYRLGGAAATVGLVVGQSTRWFKRIEETVYDRNLDEFVTLDTIEREEDPDETRFISLEAVPIRLLRIPQSIQAIANEFGASQPGEPINVDFAYNVPDMQAALDLWLRTRAGAYGWVAVDLSWDQAIDVGQSVWYTSRSGVRQPYICDRITERGAGRSVQIAARLSREYL